MVPFEGCNFLYFDGKYCKSHQQMYVMQILDLWSSRYSRFLEHQILLIHRSSSASNTPAFFIYLFVKLIIVSCDNLTGRQKELFIRITCFDYYIMRHKLLH
jgi:hypothetical protein